MRGRFAIAGLTALAILAFGAGEFAAPSTATAEFRIPGLFDGKRVVKRKRYRAKRPVAPQRNPARVVAAVSAETVSPEVAKKSTAAVVAGTAGAASVSLALPASLRVAANVPDAKPGTAETPEAKPGETGDADSKTAATGKSGAGTPDAEIPDAETPDTGTPEAETASAAGGREAEPKDEIQNDSKDEAGAADEGDTKTDAAEAAGADKTGTEAAEAKPAPTADDATDERKDVASAGDRADEHADRDDVDTKAEDGTKAEDSAKPDGDIAERTGEGADEAAKELSGATDGDASADGADTASAEGTPSTADADGADEDAAKPAARAEASSPVEDAGQDTAQAGKSEPPAPETKDTAAGSSSGPAGPDAGAAKDAATNDTATNDAAAKDTPAKDTGAKDRGGKDTAGKDTAAIDAVADDGTAKDPLAKTGVADATSEEAAEAAGQATKAAESKTVESAEAATETADKTVEDRAGAKAGSEDTTEGDTEIVSAEPVPPTPDPKPQLAANAESQDADSKDADSKDAEPQNEAESQDKVEPQDTAGPDERPESVAASSAKPADAALDRTASIEPTAAATTSTDDGASPGNDESATRAAPDSTRDSSKAAGSEEEADVTAAAPDAAGSSAGEPAGPETKTPTPETPTPETPSLKGPSLKAYDATVVLEISPPPGTGTPENGDTKLASLTEQDGLTADGGKPEEAAETGPPPPPPVDPVILAVRAKLEGTGAPKISTADLDTLKSVYADRDGDPLWIAGDGLSAHAKLLIATIGDADDWGLDAASYKTPAGDAVLDTDEARAGAELALSAAVLKYARDAQTGRLTPSQASSLFDQHPEARNPKTVLSEIAASATPDKALLALHPQNEQYQRLHTALVRARDNAKASGRDPNRDREVQRIVINMERWRWLPADLGNFHVWNNIPEFQVRVRKNGRTIYQEKTIVGQLKYATPFFSAPMRNIVFNPNWTVPPTIVREDIAPKLKARPRGGFFSTESRNAMLRRYGLAVSYKGKPIDADSVDWKTANIHSYTFTQDPGPYNVLGQFKFNFPNSHAVYMHDTTQRELFARSTRSLSHGCIRVHQPAQFAALILGEDKGWSIGNVQNVLAQSQGQTKVIALNRTIPVHLTYFTAVADEQGSVREFGDVYGIDNRMAPKLFPSPAHFQVPYSPDIAETAPSRPEPSSRPSQRRRSANTVENFLSGILGN